MSSIYSERLSSCYREYELTQQTGRWTMSDVAAIYNQPFNDLIYQAHTIHKEHHQPNALQMATLLSIKTGACPEDCGYCSQSGHHSTALEKEKLMSVDDVLLRAQEAKDGGATRFCMGAAWRCPPGKVMPELTAMIEGVKAMGPNPKPQTPNPLKYSKSIISYR